jgi:hypothetical protein
MENDFRKLLRGIFFMLLFGFIAIAIWNVLVFCGMRALGFRTYEFGWHEAFFGCVCGFMVICPIPACMPGFGGIDAPLLGIFFACITTSIVLFALRWEAGRSRYEW